ncbi:MAG: gamma-glutamyltransferase, partial [Thiohalomonadales bacterium]|nr:gamma-glutamyltransferase [Thiohalomonadales bacterium]
YHHQYLPDTIFYEPGAISKHNANLLQAMGHQTKELQRRYGNMQVVIWNKQSDTVSAASDPRGEAQARAQ